MKNVSEAVANIKKDVDKSTSGLDDLTDEVKTTCKDGLSDLSKRLAVLEEQMKELDQATEKEKQTVAFNVMDAVSYTGSEAIKFSTILLNQGNAFDKDTGIFTAPTDGIYQFNAHICSNKTFEEINYSIKVNTQWIVTGEFTVPDKASDAKWENQYICITYR
ncbi:uncharacterized protein LOC132729763 [Ruditapes philippinarum]|uniref:uncharacterized protein LOC132729763 n=1 Tax=Ruditapes philippinarum TaxID=129788 RepID=UPI00295C069D|nr:uncharacterized protein LOC132729763 [Ruditapes philippinarum]